MNYESYQRRPSPLLRTAQGALLGFGIGSAFGNGGRGAAVGAGLGALNIFRGFGGGKGRSRRRYLRRRSPSRVRGGNTRSPRGGKTPVRGGRSRKRRY